MSKLQGLGEELKRGKSSAGILNPQLERVRVQQLRGERRWE